MDLPYKAFQFICTLLNNKRRRRNDQDLIRLVLYSKAIAFPKHHFGASATTGEGRNRSVSSQKHRSEVFHYFLKKPFCIGTEHLCKYSF